MEEIVVECESCEKIYTIVADLGENAEELDDKLPEFCSFCGYRVIIGD